MMEYYIRHFCVIGAFTVSAMMSWRDIRAREVIDRELAWLSLFTVLPKAIDYDTFIVTPIPLPLWLSQSMALLCTTGGALILLSIACVSRALTGRELIGRGDIFFSCAIGFMLPPHLSPLMVFLAFLLALPFSIFCLMAKKTKTPLPFIPFLAAAAFSLYWLPIPIVSVLFPSW